MTERAILVTGAAGFVGRAVVRRLAAGKRPIRAGVRRSGPESLPATVMSVAADVLDPASLAAAMRQVEVVVHCAVGDPRDTSVITTGTANALRAADAANVRRFIQLSSVAVYGDATGRVDELAPTDRPHGAYGAAKVEAERLCRAHGGDMDVTILRPSLIYGPGSGPWVEAYLDRLKAGRQPALGRAGEGCANLVHVDDLAAFIALLATAPAPITGTFNVNGPEVPTWNDYLDALGRAVGAPPGAERPLPGRATLLLRKAARAGSLALHKARLPAKPLDRFVAMTPSADEIARFGTRVVYAIDRMRAAGFEPPTSLADAVAGIAAWDRAGRPRR